MKDPTHEDLLRLECAMLSGWRKALGVATCARVIFATCFFGNRAADEYPGPLCWARRERQIDDVSTDSTQHDLTLTLLPRYDVRGLQPYHPYV